MADLGTLVLGTYANVSSTAITGSEPVLQSIAGASDASYVYDSTNTTHTGTASFALGDTPTDFGTIISVAIRLRYLCASSLTNTWNSITAQIVKSDGTTPLTDAVTVASSITTTTATNSSVVTLTTPDTTATKADWDGALVLINWNITKNKGGDTVEKRITAAEVTGTYNVAAATLNASIAATETTDAAAVTAAIWRTAQVAATESSDSTAVSTSVTTGASLAATDSADSAALTAANWTTAQIAGIDASDTTSITGSAGAATLSASIAATDSADTVAIGAEATTPASVAAVDSADIATAVAANWMTAQVAGVESPDTVAVASSATTGAAIAASESGDAASVTASSGSSTSAGIAATESADTAAIGAIISTSDPIFWGGWAPPRREQEKNESAPEVAEVIEPVAEPIRVIEPTAMQQAFIDARVDKQLGVVIEQLVAGESAKARRLLAKQNEDMQIATLVAMLL